MYTKSFEELCMLDREYAALIGALIIGPIKKPFVPKTTNFKYLFGLFVQFLIGHQALRLTVLTYTGPVYMLKPRHVTQKFSRAFLIHRSFQLYLTNYQALLKQQIGHEKIVSTGHILTKKRFRAYRERKLK